MDSDSNSKEGFANEKVHASAISEDIVEDGLVENLGYRQELKRSFSLLGMIGFSFCVVTSWTALGGVLITGVQAGGPPVMIFSWIGVSIFSLAVAYSLAEICSSVPIAGGQYSWVFVLAPSEIARGASWVTGWTMITGLLSMGATNNFISANFVLGQVNLTHPDFVIKRWQVVLVSYAVAALGFLINVWGPRLLERASKVGVVWNLSSFVIVIAVILATNDHKQPASFVFQEFQNFTGFGTAMAAILGILQSAYGMCCYESPAHMVEEMKNGSREAPKAIIMSVYVAAVTGLIFLISICFCIGNIDDVAGSTTGVPLIQIFFDSTQSRMGSCCLASLLVVAGIFGSAVLLADGSRTLYAFSRDHGLPFSSVWSKVNKAHHVPLNAMLLAVAVQMALQAIDFGTTTGFNTVIAVGTEGYYLSYAMPLVARLLSEAMGRPQKMRGPFSLGKASVALNAIALVFLIFASITFNFPQENPVTKDNMNYTSAALGIIGFISLLTWITTGRKRFTGPMMKLNKQITISNTDEEKVEVEEIEPPIPS